MNGWQLLGLIIASALLWIGYVRFKDRHQPEPPWRLVFAFALGILAWALALLGYKTLDALQVPDIKFNERLWTALYCFGIVGPLEEGAKVLLAYLFVFRWREYDEPMDGFVYAASLSLGFASAENFYCTTGSGWLYQLGYAVALPIAHVLFSAIWGLGIGHAQFCVSRRSRRILWQIGSVALAMFAHGLYDFILYAYQAAFATSGLVLVLWVFAVWRLGLLRKRALAAMPAQARQDQPAPRA